MAMILWLCNHYTTCNFICFSCIKIKLFPQVTYLLVVRDAATMLYYLILITLFLNRAYQKFNFDDKEKSRQLEHLQMYNFIYCEYVGPIAIPYTYRTCLHTQVYIVNYIKFILGTYLIDSVATSIYTSTVCRQVSHTPTQYIPSMSMLPHHAFVTSGMADKSSFGAEWSSAKCARPMTN